MKDTFIRLAFGVELWHITDTLWTGVSDVQTFSIWKSGNEWIGAIWPGETGETTKPPIFSVSGDDVQAVRQSLMQEQRRRFEAAREAQRYAALEAEFNAN